jgi:hypothetical protein
MKIAFTLCSNNYLAQARTLGDSLVKHNSDYHFVIGLVDKFNPEIDYSFFTPYELVEIENIGILDFQSLVEKYNIVELNTAVKPFLFDYLLTKYRDCNRIMYFDPDILVLHDFGYLEDKLNNNNILLTPHLWSPIGVDNLSHGEPLFLKHGIYNLGYIGLSRTAETSAFLNWWKDRTYHLGFNNTSEGIYVDQKWIDLVPLFFKGVYLAEHLGLNVAFWNLHERQIVKKDGRFLINDKFELVFYHFSQFNPNNDVLAAYHNRYTFSNRPDTVEVFGIYRELLLTNKYNYFKPFVCYYTIVLQNIRHEKLLGKIKYLEKKLRFSWLFRRMKNYISVSKALTLKMYMDYLIDIKNLLHESRKK